MFDVSELKALEKSSAIEDGLAMELKHPGTGEDTGAVWMIRSYESAPYKAASRRKRTEGMKAVRKNSLDASKLDEDEIELMASLVAGWSGMVDGEGKEIPCTPEAVKDLLRYPVAGSSFMTQIEEVASDNEAFFKASSKTSKTLSNTK